MIKAVFDTNIYISALLFGGIPQELLRYAFAGKFTLFISPDILHETSSVLAKKFNYPSDRIKQATEVIENIAIVIRPTKTISIIKDWPADNRILECAHTAQANYLVTGDKKHLLPLEKYRQTKITSAQKFLTIIESNKSL